MSRDEYISTNEMITELFDCGIKRVTTSHPALWKTK